MTPEQIREALSQRFMCKAVAIVSGYSHGHVKELSCGRQQFTDFSYRTIADSVPRARAIVQSWHEAMARHGRPCKICGGTLRYQSNGNCVACNRQRRAAERRAAK